LKAEKLRDAPCEHVDDEDEDDDDDESEDAADEKSRVDEDAVVELELEEDDPAKKDRKRTTSLPLSYLCATCGLGTSSGVGSKRAPPKVLNPLLPPAQLDLKLDATGVFVDGFVRRPPSRCRLRCSCRRAL